MADDKFGECFLNVSSEIIERSIDVFYEKIKVQIDFVNLQADYYTEKKCLISFDDSIRKFPVDISNLKTFLKYCMYYTGMIGLFRKTYSCLRLHKIHSLLKHRVPNPDTYKNILDKLLEIARLSVTENCNISSPEIVLDFDVHTNTENLRIMDGTCDFHKTITNDFKGEDLSDGPEHVLVCHISIFIINNKGTSKILDTSNFAVSQNQTVSKSSTNSGGNDPWQKYGARPKDRRHVQKKYKDAATDQEYEMPHVRESSKMGIHSGRSPSPISASKGFPPKRIQLNESDKPINTNSRRTVQESPYSSVASNLTESTRSPHWDREYFRHLIGSDPTQQSCERSDYMFTAPFIPDTSENNTSYEKYGARPKNKQFPKRYRDAFENKECKRDNLVAAAAAIGESAVRDFSPLRHFPGFEEVFKTEEELAQMPEEMRKLQEKYEEAVINIMKSEASEVMNESDSFEQLESSLGSEQDESNPQQESLQMPFIIFPPEIARQYFSMLENEEEFSSVRNKLNPADIEAREKILSNEVKKFFKNYSHPDKKNEQLTVLNPDNPEAVCSGNRAFNKPPINLGHYSKSNEEDPNFDYIRGIEKCGECAEEKKKSGLDDDLTISKPKELDAFLEDWKQELIEHTTFDQETSYTNLFSSPIKHSTPEKTPKSPSNILDAYLEHRNAPEKSQDKYELDEDFLYLSDRSIEVTDCDSSPESESEH